MIPQSSTTVVHISHPLTLSGRDVKLVEPGRTIQSLVPHAGPVICKVNDEFVLQRDWDLVVGEGDIVVFATPPQGGGGSNPLTVVLGIVLVVAGAWTGNPALIAAGAGLLITGLISAPVFTPLLSTSDQSPSPTYNVSLSGNSARIGQAMPVLYGLHILTPDFAAQPYSEYDDEGRQFYHALLCLGVMERHSLKQIYIDDTAISNFQDVETQLIGPQYGTALTIVNPCVVNAPEIAQQDLLKGKVVGPFAVCGPGLRTTKIGIDIVCPKGLYFADNEGKLQDKSVTWYMQIRGIDNSGEPISEWGMLAQHTLTDHTNAPIRRSFFYNVPSGRYEVRGSRVDERDDNVRAGHDVQWLALRAYIEIDAPLDPDAVFLALRIRASEQLSGLSQRRISVLQSRLLRHWHPDTGWSDWQESRSIAWAAVDVLRNQMYGARLSDDRIDLRTFWELDQIWSTRGDKFDAVFDKRLVVWTALQTILRCGRATPLMRGSIFTAVRDSKPELPVALFSMRNIRRGSFNIEYVLAREDDPDGLEIEFFNEDTWSSDYVIVPAPGVDIGDVVSPAKTSYIGITSRAQVEREGLHTVQDAFLRKSRVSFETEMEGFLPSFGDPILVSHDVTGWGQNGEIEEWLSPIALCTEEIVWGPGTHYAVLSDSQGNVHGPYKIQPGDTNRAILFLELPDFPISTSTERERTRYSIGESSGYAKLCKLVEITPNEGSSVRIVAVVEDTRMHSDVNVQVPGGGSTRVARYGPDDIPDYTAATDAQQGAYGFFAGQNAKMSNGDEGYTYGDQ